MIPQMNNLHVVNGNPMSPNVNNLRGSGNVNYIQQSMGINFR